MSGLLFLRLPVKGILCFLIFLLQLFTAYPGLFVQFRQRLLVGYSLKRYLLIEFLPAFRGLFLEILLEAVYLFLLLTKFVLMLFELRCYLCIETGALLLELVVEEDLFLDPLGLFLLVEQFMLRYGGFPFAVKVFLLRAEGILEFEALHFPLLDLFFEKSLLLSMALFHLTVEFLLGRQSFLPESFPLAFPLFFVFLEKVLLLDVLLLHLALELFPGILHEELEFILALLALLLFRLKKGLLFRKLLGLFGLESLPCLL